jgi:phospholipid transport system substrate-binding protein
MGLLCAGAYSSLLDQPDRGSCPEWAGQRAAAKSCCDISNAADHSGGKDMNLRGLRMVRGSMSMRWRRGAALALAGFAALAPVAASAQGADSPTVRIDGLYVALVETMKQGKQLGMKGRYDRLAPILFKTYDVPLMARIAVGPSWDAMSPAQQQGVIEAFSRMIIATYASRFDEFSGERFEILQTLEQPPADKIVKTRLTQSNGKVVSLNYLVRRGGAEWKVVDVFLDGTISELASRRSEFTAILKSGGPDALISSLRVRSDKLLAGG